MEEESLAMVGDMDDMGWEDIIHAMAITNQVGLLLEDDHSSHRNPDYPPLVHMEEGRSIITKKNKKKRRKRKKKEKEQTEMEYQRMVHISVERNRRRQMNQHLAQLRSLMPPSYLQRGDQASIVGGAIEFVKNLEETLESLIEKRKSRSTVEKATLEPPCPLAFPNKNKNKNMDKEGSRAFCRSWNAEVEVETMGVDGFGVKVVSSEHGQLLRLITHLQHGLLLFIRHLHVATTNADTVFYSFQLHQRCNHNQVVLGTEQLISVHELAFSVLQIFDSHDFIESDLSAEICNLESPSKDLSTLPRSIIEK